MLIQIGDVECYNDRIGNGLKLCMILEPITKELSILRRLQASMGLSGRIYKH